MTTKSLLAKLTAFLSEERHVQAQKHKSLKKILRALKREKIALQQGLAEAEDNEARQDIEARLKVVAAQRKKGLDVLKGLKKQRKGTTVS